MIPATSILVVLPHDSLVETAMAGAIDLARKTGAALTLVDVVGGIQGELGQRMAAVSGLRIVEIEEDVLAYHRDRLAGLAKRARFEGVKVSEAVLHGIPHVEVVRMVLREGPDILIKGATLAPEGEGILDAVDMNLLRACPCPVWLLTRDSAPPARLLAAIAAEEASDDTRAGLDRQVLDCAVGFRDHGAEIAVVHAFTLPGELALRHGRFAAARNGDVDRLAAEARALAQDRVDQLMADYPQVERDRVIVAQGESATVIAAQTGKTGADTLVMGTVGRIGLPCAIIGDTAQSVLSRITCSVIALKPEGFVSPVTLDMADETRLRQMHPGTRTRRAAMIGAGQERGGPGWH
ncbi:MAG: universal stress protein [Rhodobacteraceae bacterium]|nr:universal stress protein [Paracoccaceae bacterium]